MIRGYLRSQAKEIVRGFDVKKRLKHSPQKPILRIKFVLRSAFFLHKLFNISCVSVWINKIDRLITRDMYITFW
jgi:hypothetical protein